MSNVSLAQRTLLDAERRQAYDAELAAKRTFAAQRDAARPMSLRVNGGEVHSWAELETAFDCHPDEGLFLLQDGEIEAWLHWSQNQRQRANWVRELAQQSRDSETPQMEMEMLLRLVNPARSLRLYTPGRGSMTDGALVVENVAALSTTANRNWEIVVDQFPYVLDWVRQVADAKTLDLYESYPADENNNIQLERLLCCINPKRTPAVLRLAGVEKGVIDFGKFQAWDIPTARVSIWQSGSGYLYGTLSTSDAWLTVTPNRFSGSCTNVEICVDPDHLTRGHKQTGTVKIVAADDRAKPVTIQVHLRPRTLLQSFASLFGGGRDELL